MKIQSNLIVDGTITISGSTSNDVLLGNGGTIPLSGLTGSSELLTSAYDDSITGITVTGSATKTITLEQRDGSTLTAAFTDNTGGVGGSGDVVTGMTFNTTDGVLTLSTLSGDTITEDLDGRYLTGFTDTNDYVTGMTFNTTDGVLTLSTLSGDTITEDLDGRYLTGFTIPVSYIETGDNISELVNDIGYITGFTDTNTNDNDYTTGTTLSGTILEFNRLSGGTFNVDLSGLTTGTTELLTSSTIVTSRDMLSIDADGLNNCISTTGVTITIVDNATVPFPIGTVLLYKQSNTGTLTITGDTGVTMSSRQTYKVDDTISIRKIAIDSWEFLNPPRSLNTDDVVTGMTFNTTDGVLTLSTLSGDTITEDLDGRYLTGFTIPASYIETGDNISELINDIGYITGFTDTNNNDYVTGMTFNTGTGVLTLGTLSGDTITEDLDGRYSLTGHTHDISDITGFTDNSTNWNTAYDDSITGITVTGSATKTITLEQRDGSTLSTNFTDNTGVGGSGDVVTGMTFNTGDGVLTLSTLSGDTITEDLDGRYLTGFTISSTYLETGDNISELVNDIGYITGFTDTNDYTTGSTLTGTILEFNRLSGGTFNVELSGLTGTGNVSKVGTPLDNQIGIWTGDGTIEGDSGLTYDGTAANIVGNVVIEDALTATKAYRFRTSGGSLDLEAGGDTWVVSNWANADFTGTQLFYLYFDNATHTAHVHGDWNFRDGNTTTSGNSLLTISSTNNEVVVNEDSGDYNFRVEGNTTNNLIFADAGLDMVGINQATPSEVLDVVGNVKANSFILSGGTSDDVLLGDGAVTSLSGLTTGSIDTTPVIISGDTYTLIEADILASKTHLFTNSVADEIVVTIPEITKPNADLIEIKMRSVNETPISTVPVFAIPQTSFSPRIVSEMFSIASIDDDIWMKWINTNEEIYITPLGDNIILNSTFDDSTNLTLDTSWSVSGGTLNFDDGADNEAAIFTVSGSVVTGDYALEFDIVSGDTNRFRVEVTGTEVLSATNYPTITGQTVDFSYVGVSASTMTIVANNSAGATAFSLDNVQLKKYN